MNEYRVDCKTIASHPSQNRKWFTLVKAYTPMKAIMEVKSRRPGENIEILAVWKKVQ